MHRDAVPDLLTPGLRCAAFSLFAFFTTSLTINERVVLMVLSIIECCGYTGSMSGHLADDATRAVHNFNQRDL